MPRGARYKVVNVGCPEVHHHLIHFFLIHLLASGAGIASRTVQRSGSWESIVASGMLIDQVLIPRLGVPA